MKNVKYEKLRQNKNIQNSHRTITIPKILLIYFIFINFFTINIFCNDYFEVWGTGSCYIETKGILVEVTRQSSPSSTFTSNSMKVYLNLGSFITKIEFKAEITDFSHMFEDCKTLTSINLANFDHSVVTTTNSMFKGCSALKLIQFNNFRQTHLLINMGSMFQSCSSLITLDLSSFDTSSVLFMNNLFHDCTSLITLDLSHFNTLKVIKMESMFENCKSLTILDLDNFYTPSLKQIYNIFSGCSSLTEIKISNFDTFQITNFAKIFYNCRSLNQISITHFITNMANDMNNMFYNCSKISDLDLSNFNTEKVVKMNSMFEGCSSLAELRIDNFRVNQVIDMEKMFKGCSKLSNLNLNNFQTNSVINIKEIFSGCLSLTSLDLNSFRTQNVINMNSMFKDCSSLKALNVRSFETSNVLDMSFMFYKCSSLTTIELFNFKTHNVEKIDSMFYDCKSLKSLSLASFKTSKINSMKSTFHGCTLLKHLEISHFDTKYVEYMDDLFYGCGSLTRFNLSNYNVAKVKLMSYMFYGCKSMTSLILPKLNNLRVTNTSHMFTGCSSLSSLDLSNFYTINVLNMDYMFSGCTYLKNLKLNNWDTRNVLSMEYIFSGCKSLTSLDISDFNTQTLTTMRGMFYGCSSIQFLDLASLDTSKVTNMAYMFYKDISLTSLIFSSSPTPPYLKTPELINMEYMFAYCSKLENIDLSYFDTHKVVDMSYMFTECANLTSVNLSNFDTNKVTSMDYMFYKCINLSYINMENSFDSPDNVISMNNILTDSLLNMIFCINRGKATTFSNIIEAKNNYSECAIVNCNSNYTHLRKKLVIEESGIQPYRCLNECEDERKVEYFYNCYDDCINGTFRFPYEYICYDISLMPIPCTIQRVLTNQCIVDDLSANYTESIEDIVKFIDDLKDEINDTFTLYEQIIENGIISKTIFNITFELSTLSNKNRYENLTFIDIRDCANLLKKENNIDVNDELILLKLEYILKGFKIPAIEYTLFTIDGKIELNFSSCQDMNFVYSYPVKINETEEYKYNPESDYNNEICFQYTTENNTDIILYDKRKEFNDYNLSLCENNCKYMGYFKNRAECECPVKLVFNKFLLEEKSVQDNLIFRFQDNHMQPVNFGIVKCINLLFSSEGFSGNDTAIFYVVILIIELLCALYFCFKGYKILYSNVKYVAEGGKKSKKLKKLKNSKKESIITTDNNPPPKLKKGETSKPKKGKKKEVFKDLELNINAPSSLIDSKNILNKNEGNLSILNKFKGNKAYVFATKEEMEINMLPYSEALQKDKRASWEFYISFLKSRHLLLYIIIDDNNSFVIKLCILLSTFGINIGINTIFFNDSIIQNIYKQNGTYTISSHISSNIHLIIISAIISSIIKSIIFLVALTDISILEINVNNGMSKEEKINKALTEVTSKSTIFFIINFILLFLCWIYAGSFCAVFINSAKFLLISALISFIIVIFLPLLYYLITAYLRRISLDKADKEKLYKFSKFLSLI